MNALSRPEIPELDPSLDLKLERVVDVPPALIWKCWTQPEHLVHWFTPTPWKTMDCRIDLRPGGEFYTKMEGPNGEVHEGAGCYLGLMENEYLSWTNALEPGFRPASKAEGCGDFFFTAHLFLFAEGTGTRYIAIAQHATADESKTHKDMGFEDGWGAVLTQLVEYSKGI